MRKRLRRLRVGSLQYRCHSQRSIVEALESRTLLAATLPHATQHLGDTFGPDVADPVRNVVYLYDQTNNFIVAINTNTGTTVGLVAPQSVVAGLAVSLDDTKLYASEPGAFSVEVFSLPQLTSLGQLANVNTPLKQIVVGANNTIIGEAGANIEGFDATTGNNLWSMAGNTNGLLRTDAAGDTLYSRETGVTGGATAGAIQSWDISTGGAPIAAMATIPSVVPSNSTDFAVDAGANHAYMEDAGVDGVEVTLVANGSMTTWPFATTGDSGVALATLPGGAFVYAATALGNVDQFNTGGVLQATAALTTKASNESLVITPNGRLICTDAMGDVDIIGLATLNVTEIPPAITVTAPASQTVNLNRNATIQLGSFAQVETTAPYTVDVNWGDGSSPTIFAQGSAGTINSKQHTFTSETTDVVSVTITDANGIVSNTALFDVTVIPSANITVNPATSQTAITGVSKLITLGNFTAMFATAPYQVDINWGDGSGADIFSMPNPGTIPTQTHTFSSNGTDTVHITVTDANGNVSNTGTFNVSVAPPASIVVTAPSAQVATSGVSASFALGSFVESSGSAPYSVNVNWGDGSTHTIFSMNGSGTINPQTHDFIATGGDTVSVTITDNAGNASNVATFSVTVAPTPSIVVTSPGNQTSLANALRTFALGTFAETNATGPYMVDVNWGDGPANTEFAMTSAGIIPPQQHEFVESEIQPLNSTSLATVSVTVTDSSNHTSNAGIFNVIEGDVSTTSIVITVNGTNAADTISLSFDGANVVDSVNGIISAIPISQISGIQVFGNGGADTITVEPSVPGTLPITINGGTGADTINGGAGNELLIGGRGHDSITAGSGNSTLMGGAGPDTLIAGSGNDSLAGGKGDDSLLGGTGNDTLRGGIGHNVLHGGTGDDTIFANNGFADTLYGGGGNNTAYIDPGLDVIPNNDIQVIFDA